MNTKGWLRIVEVTICIVLIVGAVFIFYQNKTEIKNSEIDLYFSQYIEEIAINQTIRNLVFDSVNSAEKKDTEQLILFMLSKEIERKDINYTVRICEAAEECKIENIPSNYDGEIYSITRLISTGAVEKAGETQGIPKKLRFYVWKLL